MFSRGDWHFRVQVDGVEKTYAMERDFAPDSPVCFSTSAIPPDGITIVTHSHMKRLDCLERREDVLQAIAKEYGSFDKRCVWRLVELPEGAKAHNMMLLITVKYLPNGQEEKVKARGCIMGNCMTAGVDYGPTFAPCAQLSCARVMLADAVQNNKCAKSCDVVQAFTFGTPDRPTFINCPPGRSRRFGPNGKPLVYELVKNVYGTPSGPRRWHVEIHNALCSFGAVQSTCEPCLYHLDGLNILVYVDDILSTFPDTAKGHALYDSFVAMLQTKFELQDDGQTDCSSFIGMNLTWGPDRRWLMLDSPKTVDTMLDDHGFTSCRPSFTTGVPKTLISLADCPADDDVEQIAFMKGKPYRARVGSLLWYARLVRPDIAYQVNALASVAHNPGKAHWDATSQLLRYCAHTKQLGLVYTRTDGLIRGQFKPIGFSDATWASVYGSFFDNYRSTSGWLFLLSNACVSWSSRRQSVIAQSSAESEFMAAADAAKEALFLRNLFADLHIPQHGPTQLWCDNQSTIRQSINAVDQKNSRHIGQRSHFLRHQCHTKRLSMGFVPTANQFADALTKNVPEPTLVHLRPNMGVRLAPAPTQDSP